MSMPYNDDLCREMRRCAKDKTCWILPPGQVLYRGGQSDERKPFSIRSGTIFLSSKPQYAEAYVNYLRRCHYGYLYRTTNNAELRVVSMTSMEGVVKVAYLSAERAFEPIMWQRENIIPLARQALGVSVDAVYMKPEEDEGSDEFLIDNSSSVMNLECLYSFSKNSIEVAKKELVFGEHRGYLVS